MKGDARARNSMLGFVIAMVALFAITALVVLVWVEVSNTQHDTCRQVQAIARTIDVIVVQDLRTIGTPGTAGYAYYVDHPAELAQAKATLRQEAVQFAPRAC